MRNFFFLVREFFSFKNLWNRRRQFRQPSHYFFVKFLRSSCSQSKNNETDKYCNKFFFWKRMIWTLWIQIGQSYRKVFCKKPSLIIAWNPWMCSADFKQKFLPKTPFGRVKWIIDNPAKNSRHKVPKVLRGVRENQRTVYFQLFFLEFILWIRRMPLWQLC